MEEGHQGRKSLETIEHWTFKSAFINHGQSEWSIKCFKRLCSKTALTFLTLFILEFEKGLGKSHIEESFYSWVSQVALVVKNPPANAQDAGSTWVGKIPWRREWQPTPVFLPGKSHGQRSLAGYCPWGHKRVGHNSAIKQPQ